jgi:hypothetical protein
MGWPGSRPRRPGLSSSLFYFFRKCSIILNCLQSLKIHKYFYVHANDVIQISLSSVGYYLSDDIGLIVLETIVMLN